MAFPLVISETILVSEFLVADFARMLLFSFVFLLLHLHEILVRVFRNAGSVDILVIDERPKCLASSAAKSTSKRRLILFEPLAIVFIILVIVILVLLFHLRFHLALHRQVLHGFSVLVRAFVRVVSLQLTERFATYRARVRLFSWKQSRLE